MEYFTYHESKEYLKKFKIKSSFEFYILVKSGSFDNRLNKRPFEFFNRKKRKEWISWEDFLSFSRDEKIKDRYLEFEDARKISRSLGIKSQKEWVKWCKLNDTKSLKIPTNPSVFYKDLGWTSFSDWLGNDSYLNKRKIDYLRYDDCKIYIKREFPELRNKSLWMKFDKKKFPIFIPKRPDHIYKKTNEWTNWESFLESGISPRTKSKLFLEFSDAKKYVQSLNLKNQYEFYTFIDSNNIVRIPKRPDHVYKKDWRGYIDFLGCENSKESIGEGLVKKYLEQNNVNFIREKRFKTCRNIRELPFDFYLPDKNICIEYDGEFHYKNDGFGGPSKLDQQRKNDEIKTNWCRENNINLIRISYKSKNRIFKILRSKLNA